MKTLQDALHDYAELKVDELFWENTKQMSQELIDSPDFREIVNMSLDEIARFLPVDNDQRSKLGAVMAAVFKAGIIVGADMEKMDLNTLETGEST